jgi:hypothetical protein
MYPWHREFHKDSKKSSFNFLRFSYGFLLIFQHQHKIWDIKPKKGTTTFTQVPETNVPTRPHICPFSTVHKSHKPFTYPPAVLEFADWSIVFFLGTYRERGSAFPGRGSPALAERGRASRAVPGGARAQPRSWLGRRQLQVAWPREPAVAACCSNGAGIAGHGCARGRVRTDRCGEGEVMANSI